MWYFCVCGLLPITWTSTGFTLHFLLFEVEPCASHRSLYLWFREKQDSQLCCFHNPTPILIFQLEGDVAARLLARSGPGGSAHCHDPQQWDTAEEILGLPIWDLHEKEPKSLTTLGRAFNLVELRRWKSLFYHRTWGVSTAETFNEQCFIMNSKNSSCIHWYCILM